MEHNATGKKNKEALYVQIWEKNHQNISLRLKKSTACVYRKISFV